MSYFEDDHMPFKRDESEAKQEMPNRFLHQKRTIIVDEKSQAFVPANPDKQINKFENLQRMYISTQNRNHLQDIEDYLLFAQSLILSAVDDGASDDASKKRSKGAFSGDGLILGGMSFTTEAINEQALNFLNQMDYNVVKAKFYLLFPTLLVYNQYRHQHQLNFTDEYMGEKIEQYISKLNEDKMLQQTKWRQEITELISNKTKQPLEKLQQYIDLGTQLKYEIPEQIKQIYSQAIQSQKQLNKILKNQEKVSIDHLKAQLEKYEAQIPVITNEIQQLRDLVYKSDQFYLKLSRLPVAFVGNYSDLQFNQLTNGSHIEKIQFKNLSNLITEYKQLPIEVPLFDQLHQKLYDYCQQLILKIKTTKQQQNRTRLAQSNKEEKIEKISLYQAEQITNLIKGCIVTCEDFEQFLEMFKEAVHLNLRAAEAIEDCDQQQRLLQEVSECPFYLEIQERLQSMIDYSQIVERIRQHMVQGEYQQAYDEISDLNNRGIINEELNALKSQIQQVLEWNAYCDQILSYNEQVTLVDIYSDEFVIQQIVQVQPPKEHNLDQEKLRKMKEVQAKIVGWKEQLLGLLDQKRKEPKSFGRLIELFKEGLQYKIELSLMTKARQTINQILDWFAQVHLIKKTLKLEDDCGIEGIEELAERFLEKNGQLTSLEQVDKLTKFQSPFIQGKDLTVIQALFLHVEKWSNQAKEALETQNQMKIAELLLEAKQLPVREEQVQDLERAQKSIEKVFWIQTIINQRDPIFRQIYEKIEFDESISQIKQDLGVIRQSLKKKEGPKLSRLAKDFFAQHFNTVKLYLDLIEEIEKSKNLSRVQITKLSKLKDIQKEVQNEEVHSQIEGWINVYSQWLQQIGPIQDVQKKKKQSEYTPEYLRFFKVPELLCLVVQGIEKNYLSQELWDAIAELAEINSDCRTSLVAVANKGIKQFQAVFMPQFYVMGIKFRLINEWVEYALRIISHTPRVKNLIIGQKIKPFLEYLNNQENPNHWISKKEKKIAKSTPKDESSHQEQESQPQPKSKRVKTISRYLRDNSMNFYDANVPIKKAFGHSPGESKEIDPIHSANPKKSQKRCKRMGKKVEEELHSNKNYLETIIGQSHDLLKLYESNEVYCICRQGGESAINDIQIIKSLDEKNVEQFFNHHVKLQQQVKFMICCDMCEVWYHQECMGIKKKDQKENYVCRVCLLKQNQPFLVLNQNLWEKHIQEGHELYEDYVKHMLHLEKILPQAGNYIYTNYELPTIEQFKEFIELGRQLPSASQQVELQILEIVERRLDKWLLLNDDLNSLFLESEWLPVQLPQAKEVLLQICQKEFIKMAEEVLMNKAAKSRQIKRQQIEKTLQLYNSLPSEVFSEQDHYVVKLIHAINKQTELNQQVMIQIQSLRNQYQIEQYEQIVRNYEQEPRLMGEIKFTIPKLNELKNCIQKLKQWEGDLFEKFEDMDSLYTNNLNQDYYDSKPLFQEVQMKVKEYENMTMKLPSPWVNFLLDMTNKANEYIQIIELSLQNRSSDDQFELCQNVYRLKCKLTQFKDLLNNVPKDVQIRLVQWLPFMKFN